MLLSQKVLLEFILIFSTEAIFEQQKFWEMHAILVGDMQTKLNQIKIWSNYQKRLVLQCECMCCLTLKVKATGSRLLSKSFIWVVWRQNQMKVKSKSNLNQNRIKIKIKLKQKPRLVQLAEEVGSAVVFEEKYVLSNLDMTSHWISAQKHVSSNLEVSSHWINASLKKFCLNTLYSFNRS